MKDYLANAKEELKRADHLIYVSLKYTRTVDIIKHTIDRLIAAFDFVFEGVLEKLKETGKIESLPHAPLQRCKITADFFKDDENIHHFTDFYMLLRRLKRAKYSAENEYRRHVKMLAHLEEGNLEISIDIIHEYYFKTEEFIDYMHSKEELIK